MEYILFPDWLLFGAFLLFIKIYNPTNLFLDNISINAMAIFFAIYVGTHRSESSPDWYWCISVIVFAFFVSIPYWLGGVVGSVIQQLLLLNEQSVQDKRFTDESEALSKMSSLIFMMFALESGIVFLPIINLLNNDIGLVVSVGEKFNIKDFYFLIVDYLKVAVLVASKYIIIMFLISICTAMVDLFFKKSSFSIFVSSNLKAMLIVILLNVWLFNDQLYLFEKMTGVFNE